MVKLICGLGNPGLQYKHTRHNLGFEIVDRLSERLEIAGSGETPRFEYRVISVVGGDLFLIKPVVYTNNSGYAVSDALKKFGVTPTELLVICDDFRLTLGSLRIRKSGSSGSHNGLESIIAALGSQDFVRMRAGVGPLPEWAVADEAKIPDFVLGRFERDEEKIVEDMISRGTAALETILKKGLDVAISKYNRTYPTPE